MKIWGDPFLIACALANKNDRIIGTSEVSKLSLKRSERRIPDVCETFDIQCLKQWNLIEALDFRTRFSKEKDPSG